MAAIVFAMIAMWFSGAWWDKERKPSTLAFLCALALLVVGLGGCASTEGAGFRNGGVGYRNSKACKEITPWGERWYRC